MYTVVSLIVDLAGEPDTVHFTLALFGSIFYCYGSLRGLVTERPYCNMRSHYALWPLMVWNNLICARHPRVILTFIWSVSEIKTSIVVFFFHSRFLLSLRAPVRGTLPCTAPCLPRRISQTRMITVLNLGRHHLLPGTLYPGTCPGTSGPRGKSRDDRCWIRRREPCSGSQVSGSLLFLSSAVVTRCYERNWRICCYIWAVCELTEDRYDGFPGAHRLGDEGFV